MSIICLLKEIGRKVKLRRILYLYKYSYYINEILIARQVKLSDGGAMSSPVTFRSIIIEIPGNDYFHSVDPVSRKQKTKWRQILLRLAFSSYFSKSYLTSA